MYNCTCISYSRFFFNLEPCILQKCNTLTDILFENQTFFCNRYYYRVIWYVRRSSKYIKVFPCSRKSADMMTSCNPVRSTRSSHKVNLLVVPHQKSNKYSEKAFAVVGPRLWNRRASRLQ